MCTSMLSSHLSSYIFLSMFFFFFFFIDTPTPEIYTLSLHDALPISIASLAASSIVRPAVMNNYRRHPVGVLVPIVVFGSLGAMIWAASKSKEKIAFLASGVYLTGMLVGAAFALYPIVLPARIDADAP